MTNIPVIVLVILGLLFCRRDGEFSVDRMFTLALAILAIILLSPILEAFF